MKTFKQIILSFTAFIAVLVFCELFVRTAQIASLSSTEFYKDIGRGRRRNLNYVYFNEGFGIGKFNQYSYIGEANPPQKDTKTFRCILMGDSFVESFQVFERDYFGEIAEHYLEEIYPETRIELLNFGRSGFDIADIYAYQKLLADKFNPDLVLYMLTKGDLEPEYQDPLRPRTIVVNDSLKIIHQYNPEEVRVFEKTKFLTQNSTILNMLNNARKRARLTPVAAILLDKIYLLFSPEVKLKTAPAEPVTIYQIHPVTKKIIESLDARQVIVVNCDLQELPFEFRELCAKNGLTYYDLGVSLNLMKERGVDPNEWKITNKTGHWNHEAHKVVGREIGAMLGTIIDQEWSVSVKTQNSRIETEP